jgi:hypothetical protein
LILSNNGGFSNSFLSLGFEKQNLQVFAPSFLKGVAGLFSN